MEPTIEAINQFRKEVANRKESMRNKLAALSFSEKIKILERLRDRDRVIAKAGLRLKKDDCAWQPK